MHLIEDYFAEPALSIAERARNDRKSFFSLLNKVTSFIIELGGYNNTEAATSYLVLFGS